MFKTITSIQTIYKPYAIEYHCALTCGHVKIITGYKPELYSKTKCYDCLS